MRVLITGGAGFIGSALIRELIATTSHHILNVDCLTYAGSTESLSMVAGSERYKFSQTNILDVSAIKKLFVDFEPNAVMHLAAESHVDRSIDEPSVFVQTNVVGTLQLLEVSTDYFRERKAHKSGGFKFVHVSTDEVFGDLGAAPPADESTRYAPGSPYAASKAASDHLVRSWGRTYGLPVAVTNCTNNYGPYQFPEKLIPHVILCALNEEPIPVYGDGMQIRDWLHVEDHACALKIILEKGRAGESYNIGARAEISNLGLVGEICKILNELRPRSQPKGGYENLITFVVDRPGHDLRYALDPTKFEKEFAWRPRHSFNTNLRNTVEWYLQNETWLADKLAGAYQLKRQGLSRV